jgi:H+/Cl- antiporter ClcA
VASLQSRSTLLKNHLLSIRILIGKVFCTILALLSGASVGREGPSVHIGASLFHSLGQVAQFSRFERRQGLIIAGAAAGIAAAFNAPLAGIVFAIEELKGSFEERSSGLMLSAVILAGLVSLALLGHYTHFGRVNAELYGWNQILPVILIGIGGGVFGGYFSRLILYWSPRLKNLQLPHPWLVPVFIGILIAYLGYLSGGQSFGSGHSQTQRLLENPELVGGLFPLFKFTATLISNLSGVAGGIFAPSLSIGAGFGASVHGLFPLVEIKALMILGMVAYLSAVVRAPVTAFVIVFEMTSNHLILIPLMAASFLAAGTSRLISPKSLYRGLAEQFSTQP